MSKSKSDTKILTVAKCLLKINTANVHYADWLCPSNKVMQSKNDAIEKLSTDDEGMLLILCNL